MRKDAIVLGALLLGTAGVAQADAGGAGLFVGLALGYTETKDLDAQSAFENVTVNPDYIKEDKDDSSDATEFFFGVRFGGPFLLRHLGLEAGFLNMGTFKVDATIADNPDPDTTQEDLRAEAEPKGWYYGGTVYANITDRLEIYGRGGMYDWNSDNRVVATDLNNVGPSDPSDPPTRIEQEQRGTDPYYGAGLLWNADKNWSVRGDYRRFDLAGDDVDVLSVGLGFHF